MLNPNKNEGGDEDYYYEIEKEIKNTVDDFLQSNHAELLIVNPKKSPSGKRKEGSMLLMAKEHSLFFNAGILPLGDIDEIDRNILEEITMYFDNLDETNIHKYILE